MKMIASNNIMLEQYIKTKHTLSQVQNEFHWNFPRPWASKDNGINPNIRDTFNTRRVYFKHILLFKNENSHIVIEDSKPIRCPYQMQNLNNNNLALFKVRADKNVEQTRIYFFYNTPCNQIHMKSCICLFNSFWQKYSFHKTN